MEPDKKKYLAPMLAILLLLLTIIIIPLIVAETSQKHVRKTETISMMISWPGATSG
jgi:Ca2+/Na+ antiporter